MIASPFHELYLGETVSEERFTELFSPYLVRHCPLLFKPGNVFLIGAQGSGKTMLLRLLNSETRIAYDRKDIDYPLSKYFSGDFVACEINVMRSGALEFGQRLAPNVEASQQHEVMPLYFGDFINCWLIRDLIASIGKLDRAKLRNGPELDLSPSSLRTLLQAIRSEDSLVSLLGEAKSLDEIVVILSKRIRAYRDFFHFNVEDLPSHIKISKTPVGFAVSQFARLLKESGVIGKETTVFSRIDQADDILRVKPTEFDEAANKVRTNVFVGFGQVINRMIGLRDPFVSYRLAARPSSVQEGMRIFGTESEVESDRNFKVVDIDKLLLRPERGPGLAPGFFEDIFNRRLVLQGFPATTSVRSVFGKKLAPDEKAGIYVKSKNLDSLPAIYTERLDQEVRRAVDSFFSDSPLEWRFAGAWAQQKANQKITAEEILTKPWRSKPYWIKERIQQGLLQVASSNKQRMIWGGSDDIIQLGGNSVLSFLTICQEVWDHWTRAMTEEELLDLSIEPWIPYSIQFEGIFASSTAWHEKLALASGSDLYMGFADAVAVDLRRSLRGDIAMSYPGANGFSVLVEELCDLGNKDVQRALSACVDFGILVELDHTTRYKDGKKRKKYFFSSILCPHYQLPHTRTKEPRYVRIDDVRSWLKEVGISDQKSGVQLHSIEVPADSTPSDIIAQPNLFELDDR